MPEYIATAEANANFALVKYWGKKNGQLNLPAVGSISLTVSELSTCTRVRFAENLTHDSLTLDGVAVTDDRLHRVSRFLDLVREHADCTSFADVISTNTFPTGAGLASSASGFAALAASACRALGLDLSLQGLSVLARRGSGSAARSIFGGFVEMFPGTCVDGTDAFASPLVDPSHWPLSVLVVITDASRKPLESTAAMGRSRETSPYYRAWCDTQQDDLTVARQAIQDRDFDTLAAVAEYNCMKMHAVTMTSRPCIQYWNGTTLAVMQAVRELRADGIPAFFTVDAGPQVKVLTQPRYRDAVKDRIQLLAGVVDTIESEPGPGVRFREAM